MKARIIILSSLMLLTFIPVNAQNNTELSDAEKIYGLSVLWKEAGNNFAYFDVIPETDWDKQYREYVTKVISAKSIIEYYNILRQFYALLKHAHSFVYPPQVYQDYYDVPKIKLVNIQRHIIVENVGESLRDNIPIGSEIIKVEGIPARQYLAENIFPLISASREDFVWEAGLSELLRGKAGTNIIVTFVTPAGTAEDIVLVCNSKAVNDNWVRPAGITRSVEFRWLNDDIACIALNTFNDNEVPDEFKKTLPELQKCKGLIIDLSRNGGGDSEIGFSILKYLIDKPLPTFRFKTRENISVYKAWGNWGRREYFKYNTGDAWYEIDPDTIYPAEENRLSVPVVILTGNTGSAAEDFLVTIYKQENVTLVGKTTAGCTGTPFVFDLPGGGMALITTTKEISVDGYDTRNGIKPDIEVYKTVQDIIDNKDPVLGKGIEILTEKIKFN